MMYLQNFILDLLANVLDFFTMEILHLPSFATRIRLKKHGCAISL